MFVSVRLILDPFAAIFGIVPFLGPLLQSLVGVGVTIAGFQIWKLEYLKMEFL